MTLLRNAFLFTAATALWLPGCVTDLDPNGDDDDAADDDDDNAGEAIATTDEAGVFTTWVDATDQEAWIFMSLGGGAQVFPGDPDSSTGWDLGFRRSNIKVNGGVSGVGGVEITYEEGGDFDALTVAPADGWMTDLADANDDEVPEYAFGGELPWYDYDFATHILSAADRIYFVRSVPGNYYKIQFLDYYDDVGTSGWISFRWASVDPPGPPSGWTVETEGGSWVYLDLVGESVVEPGTPETDDGWDVAVNGAMWKTNSGMSGDGHGGARLADDPSSWNLIDTDTVGFAVDEVIPIPGPPGSGEAPANPSLTAWWDYDPINHVLTSRRETFVVRTADGDYVKFRIEDHTDGTFILSVDPIDAAPADHTMQIDASDSEVWTYLNLRTGETVVPMDAAAEDHWDLRIRRTQIGTNSGTSGGAMGGGLDPEAVGLGDVDAAPAEGWSVDEMLPIPGPPGSGEFSGNPVLAAWYDYDFSTHITSPKDKAFLLATADGGYVRLKITSYDDGNYSMDWTYAGAGRDGFGSD